MMDYQRMFRGDLAILDALLRFATPISEENLHTLLCPGGEWLSMDGLRELMHALVDAGYVHAAFNSANTGTLFSINVKGHAHLVAEEAKCALRVQGEAAKPEEPVRVTCCKHGEPAESPMALICLSEDDLDEWWQSLDVEMKAAAFSGFALRMHTGFDSHIHVEPGVVRVPVLGTCAEHDAELFGKKEAENAAR